MKGIKKSQTKKYSNSVIDWAVFALLLTAVSVITLILFHRQTLGNPGWYHSDMKAYILEMQGLESKYSFPYPVFFKFAALIHLFADPELSVAIATMVLNSLAIVLTKISFNRLALGELEAAFCSCRGRAAETTGSGAEEAAESRAAALGNGAEEALGEKGGGRRDFSWLGGIIISMAAVSLFFISMLYPPDGIYLPGIKYKYLGVFTPNPFHNATYMAARPFAILAFLWYVKLLPMYEKGGEKQERETLKPALLDYILFSFFLLAATMTKPSFTLVMVSTAGLIMLYRLFRTGFRNFVPTVQLGLCFLPTFADLLYQYKGVFVPGGGEEGGVGFCFGEVWAQCCDNIPLAVCLAVGFPLAVLVMNWRECRKSTLLGFSWQFFLVSFLEAFFLYEKGFRKFDFNFSWGYMCGIFFCHFGALIVLLQVTARRLQCGRAEFVQVGTLQSRTEDVQAGRLQNSRAEFVQAGRLQRGREKLIQRLEKGKTGMLFLILQWMAYLWHLACGVYYFMVIFSGAMYY